MLLYTAECTQNRTVLTAEEESDDVQDVEDATSGSGLQGCSICC
jgi:hypothetical protein